MILKFPVHRRVQQIIPWTSWDDLPDVDQSLAYYAGLMKILFRWGQKS